MRYSPRNIKIACDHRGLTHFGGICFFHEFLRMLQLRNFLIDGQRAPLVRKAFELIGNGEYASTDAVLRLIRSMGLNTRKGRPVTPQTFHKMIQNPFYAGYVVSNGIKTKGNHDALVSEELFEKVGEKLNGKSTPHKRLNEDFPLRGFIRCAACGKGLTAGWVKGRTELYPRYWCWTKGCRQVARSKEVHENHFFSLFCWGCWSPQPNCWLIFLSWLHVLGRVANQGLPPMPRCFQTDWQSKPL